MDESFVRNQQRRAFLKTMGRSLAVGGLAGLGGYLAAKRAIAVAHGACLNDSRCSQCKEEKGCRLPDAVAYRTRNRRDEQSERR